MKELVRALRKDEEDRVRLESLFPANRQNPEQRPGSGFLSPSATIKVLLLCLVFAVGAGMKANDTGKKTLSAGRKESFDVTQHSIPLKEISDGGVAKDTIPALIDPKFIPAKKVRFLSSWDRVLGVKYEDTAKAYPIRILNYHELVNDTVQGKPILVSW
jgi:hypothetical protein